MNVPVADWTKGGEGIAFQRCEFCAHRQYFERAFCASCGSAEVVTQEAAGIGTVYAATLVHRAATPEARAHVPYMIVLVDMAEGFRIMAQGAPDLAIGDAVAARFTQFAGRIVPHFERTQR